MNFISFEDFEKDIINKMLEEETSENLVLREQFQKAYIKERKFTGVGFFTPFEIKEGGSLLSKSGCCDYAEATMNINRLGKHFGCTLFIKDGKIDFLEGYTYLDVWPEVIFSYEIEDVILSELKN